MKIYQTKESDYINNILNEICKNVFSIPITNLLDINYELQSTRCIVNIGENTLYIKFSSVRSFIKKDYDVNWILQDLNISPRPITFGYLKNYQLHYSIFEFNNISLFIEKELETDLLFNCIEKYHSAKIIKNDKIENSNNFFLRKYVFDNFYNKFPPSLREHFLNLTYYYGEIYEKLKLKLKGFNFIEDESVLLHGDMGEKTIIAHEKDYYLYNFENSFYGHPSIDICFLDINLKFNKNSFLQRNFNSESLSLDILLNSYEICLLKKAADFIFDIIFQYSIKEINSQNRSTKNFLNLNFFSQVEEIAAIQDSIVSIINHSNV